MSKDNPERFYNVYCVEAQGIRKDQLERAIEEASSEFSSD